MLTLTTSSNNTAKKFWENIYTFMIETVSKNLMVETEAS